MASIVTTYFFFFPALFFFAGAFFFVLPFAAILTSLRIGWSRIPQVLPFPSDTPHLTATHHHCVPIIHDLGSESRDEWHFTNFFLNRTSLPEPWFSQV